MTFRRFLHIAIFLVITLGMHFGFKAMGWPGSVAALGFIPIIYAIIHVVKAIINLIRGRKRAFVNSLIIALLFGLIAYKLFYFYYNLLLSIIVLVFAAWVTRLVWKKDADDNSKKNKITLTVLLVLSAIVICIPDASVLQYVQIPRALQWQKLKVEDFEGAVVDTAHHDAETSTGINYKVNEGYNYPVAVVYAQMTPSRSWMRKIEDNKPSYHELLLEHEQGHFDIVEFYKRKIYDSISGEWGRPAKEVEGIILYWSNQVDLMQDIYDKSTDHGVDSLSQHNWTAFLHKTLDSNGVPNPNDLKKLALTNKGNGFRREPTKMVIAVDTTNWKILTGTGGDYSIRYPNNWEINYNASGATAFLLVSPQDSLTSYRAGISLSIQDTVGDSNVNSYASGIVEGTKNKYDNVSLLESKRIKVGTVDYCLMVFTLAKNDVKYEQELWFRITGNKAYALHFLTVKDAFDKHRKTGETIMASFTLTK